MGYNEIKNWESVFADVNCLRVLMYLAKYNPNRPFEEIQKRLEMSKSELNLAIRKLTDAQLVNIDSETFTLKRPTMIALDNFIGLTGTVG